MYSFYIFIFVVGLGTPWFYLLAVWPTQQTRNRVKDFVLLSFEQILGAGFQKSCAVILLLLPFGFDVSALLRFCSGPMILQNSFAAQRPECRPAKFANSYWSL